MTTQDGLHFSDLKRPYNTSEPVGGDETKDLANERAGPLNDYAGEKQGNAQLVA